MPLLFALIVGFVIGVFYSSIIKPWLFPKSDSKSKVKKEKPAKNPAKIVDPTNPLDKLEL